jgi:UDP-N-acetylglucosamine--N-acetylmuramyl-(pentapeptide) pyrophosphoryl-undecaprenol N-acetylglucosamine transferase
MRSKIGRKFIITGGGSGGHVSVAVALIDELQERYDDLDKTLLFVGGDLAMEGDKGGVSLEARRMEEKKVNFAVVRGGKLQRNFTFNTIPLLFRTLLGFFDAHKIVKEFQPEFVISTGGYVSIPVVFIAWLIKIPIYIHEQTAAVGLSNKICSRFAKKIYVTFPESIKYFDSRKTVHVGNAIRKSVFNTKGQGQLTDYLAQMVRQKKSYPIIYFSGGGFGSHILNITVRQMLPYLLQEFQVVLQTGDNQTFRDYDAIYSDWKSMRENLRSRLYVTKFVSDSEIGNLFANVDMFVGRSGANTVYELGALGIPAILIPIPWVTHNEQELNAQILVNIGQAKILPEGELTPEKLNMTVERFWQKIREGLKVNKKVAAKTFRLDAVDKMISDIFSQPS